MEMKIYTVFDKAAEEAGPLFVAVNDAVASRQYRQLLKDTPEPSEYELYCVGTYLSDEMAIEYKGAKLVVVDLGGEK